MFHLEKEIDALLRFFLILEDELELFLLCDN